MAARKIFSRDLLGNKGVSKDATFLTALAVTELKSTFHDYFRYLATGDSQYTIADSYRLGHSTVNGIIHEMCAAIWSTLNGTYMAPPHKKIGLDS